MPDLDAFVIELIEKQSVDESILELSDRVSSEPCLREILLLAKETDQFNRGLKTNNEKEAEINFRECLELSILKTERDYLYNSSRRLFEKMINAKKDNLRENKNKESLRKEFDVGANLNIAADLQTSKWKFTQDFDPLVQKGSEASSTPSNGGRKLDKTSNPKNQNSESKKSFQTTQKNPAKILSGKLSDSLQILSGTILITGLATAGLKLSTIIEQSKKSTPSSREQLSQKKQQQQDNWVSSKTEDNHSLHSRLFSNGYTIEVTHKKISNINDLHNVLKQPLQNKFSCEEIEQITGADLSRHFDLYLGMLSDSYYCSLMDKDTSILSQNKRWKPNKKRIREIINTKRAQNFGTFASVYGYEIESNFGSKTWWNEEIYYWRHHWQNGITLNDFYRNKKATEKWLDTFAYKTEKGELKTNYVKIPNHPIRGKACFGTNKLIPQTNKTTLYVECHELAEEFKSGLIGGTRFFYPQIPISNTFHNKSSGKKKAYTCHPETKEFIFNNAPLLKNNMPYFPNCGKSKTQLYFKYNTRGKMGTDAIRELESIRDMDDKKFEARRIKDRSDSMCRTESDVLNNTIAIWHICQDQYLIHHEETGLPTNTILDIEFIGRISFLTAAKTAYGVDPKF